MIIKLLPFQFINGFADVEDKVIYLRNDIVNRDNLQDIVIHEVAHILSESPDHNESFNDMVISLGGARDDDKTFETVRKRLGIPSKYAANIGNISGIQNILLDYHLLAAYRKSSQKILGTEGHWEVINEGVSNSEGDSLSAKDQLIRLYPTPKGSFPVTVLYIPVVTHFRSPQAMQLAYDMMLAEAKIALGNARRKLSGIPTPDGGSLSLDGGELVSSGEKEREDIIKKAINLGEPMPITML